MTKKKAVKKRPVVRVAELKARKKALQKKASKAKPPPKTANTGKDAYRFVQASVAASSPIDRIKQALQRVVHQVERQVSGLIPKAAKPKVPNKKSNSASKARLRQLRKAWLKKRLQTTTRARRK